jgi:hypothetical protein
MLNFFLKFLKSLITSKDPNFRIRNNSITLSDSGGKIEVNTGKNDVKLETIRKNRKSKEDGY